MEKNIYNEEIENLYKKYNTSYDGLNKIEAEKRLAENGENKLKEPKPKSNLVMFLSQFNDLMIILLIIASILSFFVSYLKHESYVDSIIIIVIVIINSILSFIQEKKADVAIKELNKMFVTSNHVIRDGIKESIDVRNIVVGDIVELEGGDYVSADARVIESVALEVNESTLTGESKSVEKNNVTLDGPKELYERSNMVFAGCNVINGHAKVLVTNTGMDTELGKIATSLTDKKANITPLQRKINQISKVLTYIILIIIIVMMIIGLILKNDFFDVLMLSISLAVAAIPEGMSSVITIILSLGMTEMAKRNVIVRKMASIETLGSTDIICSDKTGTITENKMVVKSIYVNDKLYNEFDKIENFDLLKYASIACQNVVKNADKYIGDETEVAIYKYLENNKYDFNIERIEEIPFDSDRKMMTTVNIIDNNKYSFTKGSLDSILNNSKYYMIDGKVYKMTNEYLEKIRKIENGESEKSLRLLAYAYKSDKLDKPEVDMIFLGLIGMMDPPRSTVLDSISTCKKAGLKPIMITGDSIKTAVAIAKSVNIINSEKEAIEGKEVDKMTDDELLTNVLKYRVYARITPNCKLRIVEALQAHGYVVAMTGDGVNDAPAIQKADIGIGMGITGTEVVKKVADCILVDDSFSTIVVGVEEGRRITSNIKKVITYLLAGNIIEVLLVFVSMILNMEMFTTIQLLWINLITDSIPAIMLAFEKSEDTIMEDNPSNKSSTSFFTPFIISKIGIEAILKSVIIIFLFIFYAKLYNPLTSGSLMFIYLIMNELLYSFSCRNLKKSVLNKDIFQNKKLNVGLLILFIFQILILTTGLSQIFIVSVKLMDVFVVISICILVFVIGEIIKPIYSRLFKDYVEAK